MQSILFACCLSLLLVNPSRTTSAQEDNRVQKITPVLQTARLISASVVFVPPAACAVTPVLYIAHSAVPRSKYEFVDLSDLRTPSRTKLLRDREICLGLRNLSGQRISTEIVGREGNEYVTINGEQVVAPPDMGYHDITHAFLWAHGKKHDLGTLPNYKNSTVHCINAAGQIVGTASSDIPVLWQDGKVRKLPTPDGVGEAHWINAAGDIVGQGPGACIWRHGRRHSLGELDELGRPGSVAYCINDRAEVVGYGFTHRDTTHAFLYRGGKMRDLGTLPTRTDSYAKSINNKGDIVGVASGWIIDPTTKAFSRVFLHTDRNLFNCAVLWHKGTCIDLNAFVPAKVHVWLSEASGIDDAGNI